MKTTLLGLMLLCGGCATTSGSAAALERREAVRKFNAANDVPVDVDTYRSTEGLRGVTWGMTQDEVVAIKGEPQARGASMLMYLETVDDQPTPTTYAFVEGHLASAKSRFEGAPVDAPRLEEGLSKKFGPPTSRFNKLQARVDAMAAAETLDAVTAILGGLSMILSVANIAAGRPPPFYPLYWHTGSAANALTRQALTDFRPERDVSWASKDTSVRLIGVSDAVVEVTWTSRSLSKKLVERQLSDSALNDLAKDL